MIGKTIHHYRALEKLGAPSTANGSPSDPGATAGGVFLMGGMYWWRYTGEGDVWMLTPE